MNTPMEKKKLGRVRVNYSSGVLLYFDSVKDWCASADVATRFSENW